MHCSTYSIEGTFINVSCKTFIFILGHCVASLFLQYEYLTQPFLRDYPLLYRNGIEKLLRPISFFLNVTQSANTSLFKLTNIVPRDDTNPNYLITKIQIAQTQHHQTKHIIHNGCPNSILLCHLRGRSRARD